jgi:nucleotide-binding universal stress UspA family protein
MSEPDKPNRQRVLVPMDFSESARLALKAALRLARPPKDVVHLFYVPGFYAKTTEDVALRSNPFRNGAENAGRHFLAWTQSEGSGVVVEILPQMGVAGATVVAGMAIQMRSTLIVLTRRQYTFWERLFGGCPAEELPRIAPCPVHFVDAAGETGHEPEPR